jgi:hypothetical protein
MQNPERPTVVLAKANRFPTGISMENFPPLLEQQQSVLSTTDK